ncbi:MAG: pilus assembly protein [Acidobacteriia bacterium]|nr:pilus assembly protein [Terriglobia bacterium]
MRHKREKGSSILEFALVSTFLLVPLILVLATVGMSILKSIHVTELSRDAGRMYARGVDFGQTSNVNLLLQLADGLNITAGGGDGVIILSKIEATGNQQVVCAQRLVIGNASLHASDFASPTKFTDAAEGMVDITDASADASSFLNVLNMNTGDTAYVAETFFQGYSLQNLFTGSGMYVRSIF